MADYNADVTTLAMADNKNWIDATVPMHPGLVHWPGDPEPTFIRISEIEQGAEANVTLCHMTAHTGTHMDAPAHFLRGGAGIETFPLDVAMGPARVIDVGADCNVIRGFHLEEKGIERGDRVLLKTRNSGERWHDREFKTDYVALDASAAQFLAETGVRLIGIDYLSIGVFKGDGADTHRILLSAGIWIVEGIDLSSAAAGLYELICLPLRIEGSDGSPARVLLKRL